ncbi:MAG: hypothetical protein MI747_08995 [Desulfobacterales bacterium]|nr:hypothetical protein [Desulfobacterales bacterium]
MRNVHGSGKTKQMVTLFGILWVAGLILTGSEGPYMPWLNGFGALLFLKSSIVLGQWLPRLERSGKNSYKPNYRKAKNSYTVGVKAKNGLEFPFSKFQQRKAAV